MSGGVVAVTGANGFVGRALVKELRARGRDVRPVVRTAAPDGAVAVGAIGPMTDWSTALANTDVVVHTAACVHVMAGAARDAVSAFRVVNVDGTKRLAQQAVQAGVRRLIFLSSIKVNGEETPSGKQFTVDDAAAPVDAYGISKWEAEQVLHAIAGETGLEVGIIRPPLIYGPGVKANFLSLLRAISRGIPLPLAGIRNRRSFVALDNLVDLIVTATDHPSAANRILLAGDNQDLSTPDLIRRLARTMDRPARLFPVPTSLLLAGATLLGKRQVAQRLCASLRVDITKTRELLGWEPPVSIDDGLTSVVRWYLEDSGMEHP